MDPLRRISHRLRWWGLVRHAAAAVCLLAAIAARADEPNREYQIKAAFLLNFTKFVAWPDSAFPDAHAPLTICVLGDDPFGGALDRLVQGEEVNGHSLAVERIRRTPRPKSCQVLFVGKAEKEVAATLRDVGPGVLTVGEGDSFLKEGGMIAFVLQENHVRFDIRQRAASAASLALSARLLGVARSVQR